MRFNPGLKLSHPEGGMSIVGVLVAFALVSILMAMLADAATLSARVQRNVTIQGDYTAFGDSLKMIVAHEAQCTPALKGSATSGALIVRDPSDSTRIVGAAGDFHQAGWTISRLELQDAKPVPGSDKLKHGTLYLEVRKEMKFALGAPIVGRAISDVYFETGAPNSPEAERIMRCYGTESIAQLPPPAPAPTPAPSPSPTPAPVPSPETLQQAGEAPSADTNKDKDHTDNGNHYGEIKDGEERHDASWANQVMKISDCDDKDTSKGKK